MIEAKTMAPQPEYEIDEARQAVARLLGMMGIERVVVVDDEYVELPELEDLIGLCEARVNAGDAASLQEPPLEDVNFEAGIEVWRPRVTAAWEKLDEAKRLTLFRTLGGTVDLPKDTSAGILGDIIQDKDLQFFSLEGWKANKDALLTPGVAEKTLFLFDQDMRKDQKGRPDEGMYLVADVLRATENLTAYCGLLSNKIQPEEEAKDWHEFSQKYEIQEYRDRFAIIAKKHLESKPLAFAFRLKRVAITSHCQRLRDRVCKVFSDALQEAHGQIKALSVYDFEQIVFQSSCREGVWEPDTLFRLFGLFQRAAARGRANEDQELHATADRIRSVIDLEYEPEDAPEPASRRIYRLELYEEADYLARHRMPTELGDIYENGGNGKQFVLLAQPCDLMMRREGKRGRVDEGILVQIVEESRIPQDPGASFELPHYQLEGTSKWYAHFGTASRIKFLILDLCVFAKDGVAGFKLDGKHSMTGLIPVWKEYFERVKKAAELTLNGLEKARKVENATISKEADRMLRRHLTCSRKGVVVGDIDIGTKTISYPLRRIGRLKKPHSEAMLRAYAHHLCRDAFEHELCASLRGPEA